MQCRRPRPRIEPEHHIRREHLEQAVEVSLLQQVDLPLHRGWNPVVAVFSVPRPGHIVAQLKRGSNPAEKWYFFAPPTP